MSTPQRKSRPRRPIPADKDRLKGTRDRAENKTRFLKAPRLRLLPVVIFLAVLTLSVRLGDLWQDIATLPNVEIGGAQAQAPETTLDSLRQSILGAAPPPVPPSPLSEQVAQAAPGREAPGGSVQVAQGEEEIDPDSPISMGPAGLAVDPLSGSANFSQTEIELLQRLAERREAIERRQRELDAREGLLRAAEQRIDDKIRELRQVEETIAGLLQQHNEEEQMRITQLVRIYANMKPRDAAVIFNELELPILLTVFENMAEMRSSPILAAMDPARARLVTEELSRRRDIPVPEGTAPQAAGGG